MTGKKVLFEKDLDTSSLARKQIGIVGYGAQGRAQALNLRDSGFSPIVGVRAGKSFDRAVADGMRAVSVAEAAGASDIVMVLTPDETQRDLLTAEVIPHTKPGAFLGFSTGFNVHFGLVDVPPNLKAFLVAPKGPGDILRMRFEQGSGIPALVASLREDPEEISVALAYAKAIGCGRAAVIETTFAEEAIADLFGEQAVLCGGMVELMRSAFDVLVGRGYTPEVAYIECVSEVEYIAALIARVGLARLGERISSTALYGGATRGSRLIDEGVRTRLSAILDEIEDGRFVDEFRKYAGSRGARSVLRRDTSALEAARSSLTAGR